ncbi:MAG: (d)CMP kinase [Erysipelotrichaceae bacterium]
MKINIAIDGPSAAGKSTISKRVASELGYRYLDTGAMYRCVALKVYQNKLNAKDEEAIMNILADTKIEFGLSETIYLDGVDVSEEIRKHEISFLASTVSLLPQVRLDLVQRQRKIARLQPGIVMDGRDIGSVVLKDEAQLKIFLTADSHTRAQRRYDELYKKNLDLEFDEVLDQMKKRDLQDSSRKTSPLIKVAEAYEIDSSKLSIEEVVNKIVKLAKEKGA